jgi:hypothetical protein
LEKHAADLEIEMLKRGMLFEVIDWDEGRRSCPLTHSPPLHRNDGQLAIEAHPACDAGEMSSTRSVT